jgi:hypothetical protein
MTLTSNNCLIYLTVQMRKNLHETSSFSAIFPHFFHPKFLKKVQKFELRPTWNAPRLMTICSRSNCSTYLRLHTDTFHFEIRRQSLILIFNESQKETLQLTLQNIQVKVPKRIVRIFFYRSCCVSWPNQFYWLEQKKFEQNERRLSQIVKVERDLDISFFKLF